MDFLIKNWLSMIFFPLSCVSIQLGCDYMRVFFLLLGGIQMCFHVFDMSIDHESLTHWIISIERENKWKNVKQWTTKGSECEEWERREKKNRLKELQKNINVKHVVNGITIEHVRDVKCHIWYCKMLIEWEHEW